VPKGQRLTDEEVSKRLLQTYPERVVIDLGKTFKNNNGIVVYLKREAKKNNVNLQDYLSRLGFEFKQKRDYSHIVERLLELYPNRIINESITKYKWYRIIAVNSHKYKLKPKDYLKFLGFTIKKTRKKEIQ
jgi:uncharacterized protein YueI